MEGERHSPQRGGQKRHVNQQGDARVHPAPCRLMVGDVVPSGINSIAIYILVCGGNFKLLIQGPTLLVVYTTSHLAHV